MEASTGNSHFRGAKGIKEGSRPGEGGRGGHGISGEQV